MQAKRNTRTFAVSLLIVAGALAEPALARQNEPDVLPGRYIVELEEAPVVTFDGVSAAGGGWKLAPTRVRDEKLDVRSAPVRAYRKHLEESFAEVSRSWERALGRKPVINHRYEFVMNGAALELTEAEAQALAAQPGVRSVRPVTRHWPQTDAGPAWIGAPEAWAATGGMGEGIVVGVIDSGINWNHPAFAAVGDDGHVHSNPRNRQFGLCSNPQVGCNDKLIGVYDFTGELQRIGLDTDGHGTHVASTVVGNRRRSNVAGITTNLDLEVSGVAPHANVISYKACLTDDVNTPEDEGFCVLEALLASVDQAVADQVDVVNYSIGGNPSDPWADSDAQAMLNARAAGVLFVVSAGNSGSAPATITSPANAPWVMAVANTTHNRRFDNVVDSLTGGNAAPPGDLSGVGFTGPFGPAPIVHAADFGNALCGSGEPELQGSCDSNTGRTNPFAPGTFNGEIVVCDRGTYGRVEKGYNLRAAGAGGYILANTAAEGESIVSDDHCLPATHVGRRDGDELRAWLAAGGDDLTGRISGQSVLINDAFGDQVSASSSRGPDAVAVDVVKPDIAAPGSNILAAGVSGDTSAFRSGTSMASPHVSGSAALLLAERPGLTPSEAHSLLVTTAFNDGMRDSDGVSPADAYDVGGGLVSPEAALRAALVLPISRFEYITANPASGGRPGDLNLPSLASSRCVGSCTFSRRVRAIDGGAWTVSVASTDGITGVLTPSRFELDAGAEQNLSITLNVGTIQVNQSVTGYVVLTPDDPSQATQRLPFQLRASAGELPEVFALAADQNQGSELTNLAGLGALPGARFDAFSLRPTRVVTQNLVEDPTRQDPYDNLSAGVYFLTENVSAASEGGMLFVRTEPGTSQDLDLFVGRDTDGDLRPELSEELCRSTSPTDIEVCVIDNLQTGQHWILVQNWQSQAEGTRDAVTVRVGTVRDGADAGNLVATGPGEVAAGAAFPLRLIWNEGSMEPGEVWVGAVEPRSGTGGSLGRVPVLVERSANGSQGTPGAPDLETQAGRLLAHEQRVDLTLAPHQGHSRLFLDVSEATRELTVTVNAPQDVEWRVVRESARFAAPAVASATASGGTRRGTGAATLTTAPGRYYVVPVNTGSGAVQLDVTASVDSAGGALPDPVPGLWFNPGRDGAGFNLNQVDDQLIVEWYTYMEDGTPTWYLAQGSYEAGSGRFEAPLSYFSWDGATATATEVGKLALVWSDASNMVFDFEVNGVAGSEPYTAIIADLSCASNGPAVARTGLWFVPALPGFGYSILSAGGSQVHINYLYGPTGLPRWTLGQGPDDAQDIELAQFSGFCPACSAITVSSAAVGRNTIEYSDSETGVISTQVNFTGQLTGAWQQSGDIANLTPAIQCP
ncbi:MAG: S8 family serine peptidase [Pseudomonadota bacterium]